MDTRSDRDKPLEGYREQRLALDRELEQSEHELTPDECRTMLARHRKLRKEMLGLVASGEDETLRVGSVVEVIKTLESELIHLHNFLIASEDQDAALARQLEVFLREMVHSGSSVITRLESTYFLGILSMYEGELDKARSLFEEACESEESDEANDIKYKSFVILGHLSHVQEDYAKALEMHDQSIQYTRNSNVTAQALALKALNNYALQNREEALEMFEKAIELFRADQPYYNEYFHRNSLLFCGAILFDREEYDRAERYYEEVLEHVESSSYDHFDALVQLGKIRFTRGDYEAAASVFEQAVEKQKNENEYLLDTLYWLARAQLKTERTGDARRCLEKVVSSPVAYRKKPQAEQLLARVS